MNNKHSVDSNSVVENALERDRRRRFHHWAVTVIYEDVDEFQRVYKDEARARGFAARQEESPVVETTKVRLIS